MTLQWKSETVLRSQASSNMERLLYMVLIQYQHETLVVAGDHIFMMQNKRLITADRLKKGDILLSTTGTDVHIEAVHIGSYKARFHHISTALPSQSENTFQFIDTNGLMSGDYSMPLYLHDGRLKDVLVEGYEDLPVVGSHEYIKIHGDACLQPPEGNTGYVMVVDKLPDHSNSAGPFFLPAIRSKIKPPPNAHFLIPPEEAQQMLTDPSRPNSDRLTEVQTNDLLALFRFNFNELVISLDWNENSPNAFASIENGERHVVLFGGLARHLALDNEGVALFVAHEVGHHLGGGIFFPGQDMHCEGQSDFNGVGHMKKVFSLESHTVITSAIEQVSEFFGVPNSPIPPGGAAHCHHPARPCRVATYHAALRTQPKPACAE